MSRKGRDERDEDDRIKVHSLGYMQEKFKSNIPNCEHRYLLTCTTFIRVGAQYRPTSKIDERTQSVEELILCSEGIEQLCDEIYNYRRKGLKVDMKARQLVSHDVAEAKRLLEKVRDNSYSLFYDQLRNYLEGTLRTVGSDDFQKKARQIGKDIRDAVRQEITYEKEKKIYIRGGSDIKLSEPIIVTIEREIDKIRRAFFDRED